MVVCSQNGRLLFDLDRNCNTSASAASRAVWCDVDAWLGAT